MKSVAIIPLVLGIMLAAVSAARADDTLCTTGPFSGVINGNVVVPDGATCDLENATVTGNVLVQKGAILFVGLGAPVTISGNLQADQCASVILSNGGAPVSVGGNVGFHSCTGPGVIGFLTGQVTIHGNFLCQSNSAPCVAENGSIDGNANVSNNSGGTSFVVGNQIGGNLLCFGNTDVSDGGVSNTVAGKKLGQCKGL
jgi:hypothetical protein